MRLRQLLRWGRIFLLFAMAVLGLGISWWSIASRPLLAGEERVFVIPRGEGLDTITRRLQKEGLVRNAFAFKFWMMLNGREARVQAGSFRLRPGLTYDELAEALATGVTDIWVTFPEGWRFEQYAVQLNRAGLAIDYSVWQALIEAQAVEGYLFPDTYLFPRQADEKSILAILTKTFEDKIPDIWFSKAVDRGLSREEVIVFASMVEREVRHDEDRPLVAGVMIGRWQEGWALQLDATVQYALATQRCRLSWEDCDWWQASLTRADLAISSPYNTYQQAGLPPQPIANPGLEAIRAVVEYQETDYRYYLSDSQGMTHFARTLDEHNANVRQYLQ